MKLIDLLVRELPKRGGWPKGVEEIKQCWDGQVWYDDKDAGIMSPAEDARRRGEAFALSKGVYREQYEEALAASQQPAWNGEGLPPVGCECELFDCEAWNPVRIKYVGDKYVTTHRIDLNSERVYRFAQRPEKFRPTRTEAERKRDDITGLMRYSCTNFNKTDVIHAVGEIYDAIAAGKIPGIRLDGDA